MIVRTAAVDDAERLLEIYAPYVQNTAITFEYDVPSLPEFQSRIRETLKKYPYLVLEDENGIQGYCYAGPFKTRAAYSRSCELSIYTDCHAHGKGYGRALYEAMEEKLRQMGMLNMYAVIASPVEEDEYLTRQSEQFHAHMGFVRAAVFHLCGYKFGRWYNSVVMEKMLGEHI